MPDVPRCAYCRRQPTELRWRPFCSARCKLADLGRWLSEGYRVPDAAEGEGLPTDDPGEVHQEY